MPKSRRITSPSGPIFFRCAPFIIGFLLMAGCASTDQQIDVGLWHYQAGLYPEARYRLLQGVPELESSRPNDPRLSPALIALGVMAEDDNRSDLAKDFYARALKAAETHTPRDDNLLRNALVYDGMFFVGQEQYAAAVPLLERATGISERDKNLARSLYATDLDNLGVAYEGLGRHGEANALSLRALKVLDGAAEEKDAARTRGIVLFNLGASYVEQKRDEEAEKLFREALVLIEPSGEQWRIEHVVYSYASLLRRSGRDAEASALEAKYSKRTKNMEAHQSTEPTADAVR